MKTIPAEFLNVDLDLKSAADPGLLLEVWGNRVVPLHIDRIGRRHWLRLSLSGQPTSPGQAILRFCDLVRALPGDARALWQKAASREFDIGVQAGFESRAAEWVLEPKVLKAVAEVRGRLRVTVYSPLALVQEKERRLGRKAR